MPLKLEITTKNGYKWIGWCKERLAALTRLRLEMSGNAIKKTYAFPDNLKAQVISSSICDIIRIWGGSLSGVIFHPRSGLIEGMPYTINTYGETSTPGVAGGWKNGVELLATSHPFPLDDEDNASFILASSENGAFAMDSSRYGNLYWTNGEEAPEKFLSLSWRGTPTRHFALPSGTNLPGFSNIERLREVNYDLVPVYTPFWTNLYRDGREFLKSPRYTWPLNGPDRCLILGAMEDGDGNVFIVTQSDLHNAPTELRIADFLLALWRSAAPQDDQLVDGWHLIAQKAYAPNGLPWFGNASGNEFACSNGDRLNSDGTFTLGDTGNGNYSETYDGDHWNCNANYAGSAFYEFAGDILTKSTVSFLFATKETSSGSSKPGETYRSNTALLFTASDAAARLGATWSTDNFDTGLTYPDKNPTPGKIPGEFACINGQPMVLQNYQCQCNYHGANYLQNLVNNHLPYIEVSVIPTGDGYLLFYWTWDSQGEDVCGGCPNVAQFWTFGPTESYGIGTPSETVCGDVPYYEITLCDGTKLMTGNLEFSVNGGIGPVESHFDIATDYLIDFAGVEIPIVRTSRRWSATVESTIGQPTGSLRGIYGGDNVVIPAFCGGKEPDIYSTTVSENCVVEKSTLHYLDQRYGVLLYRYVRESLAFTKNSSGSPVEPPGISSAVARFQGPWGLELYWKVALSQVDILADGVEEWHLIVNGVSRVISRCAYQKQVLSGRQISGKPCDGIDAWGETLLFPAPTSYSNPVDCDMDQFGWYRSGEQAGAVNYFYPDWCKALQQDPVWLAAEAMRQGVVFEKGSLTGPVDYSPPPITVDPIPRGSYAKHPAVGEVYQWLTTDRNGINKVTASPELTALIDSRLPKDLKTHDTTLLYPISLA